MPSVFYKAAGWLLSAAILFSSSVYPNRTSMRSQTETAGNPQIIEQAYAPQAHEKIVSSFSEFSAAITDSTTTMIYLASDIVIDASLASNVLINAEKTSLVIDGIDPNDEANTRHTLTEYYSADIDRALYLRTNSTLKSITLKNLKIRGKNHYGTVSVNNDVKDCIITYDNIHYEGPQLTYNRYGTAYYIDSEIYIGAFDGASGVGEVGEVGSAILGGNVVLKQVQSQANEIFFFETKYYSAPKIELLENASVDVTAYSDSGFLYAAYSGIALEIGKGASLVFHGGRQFWENMPFSSVNIASGGKLEITIDSIQDRPMLQVNGNLTVHENASLHLYSPSKTATRYLIAMNGGNAAFRDPKSVILYSANGQPIYFNVRDTLAIDAQQVNYWTTLGNGGLDDVPQSHWIKKDESNLTVDAIITGTAYASIDTNFDPSVDDSAIDAPNSTTFQLTGANVISFGRLDLTADFAYHTDQTSELYGDTESYAELMAYSKSQNTQEELELARDQAYESGGYLIEIDTPQEEETEVFLRAAWNYLRREASVILIEKELSIQVDPLFFRTTMLSSGAVTIPRAMTDWGPVITDKRGIGKGWRLTVKEIMPLSPVNPAHADVPHLTGALVFVDADGAVRSLSSELLLAAHTSTSAEEVTRLQWPADRGFFVQLAPGEAYAGVQYEALLLWTLVDAP